MTETERKALADRIESELLRYEVAPGASLLDAIAFFRSEKTVEKAKENIGDLAAWIADAIPAPVGDDYASDLRSRLVSALDGHTQHSRDCHLSGEYLVTQIWPIVSAALASPPPPSDTNPSRGYMGHGLSPALGTSAADSSVMESGTPQATGVTAGRDRQPPPPSDTGETRKHLGCAGMSPELQELLEKAKGYEMSAAERYEQRRSFVRGMCPDGRDFGEWCKSVDKLLPPLPGGERA